MCIQTWYTRLTKLASATHASTVCVNSRVHASGCTLASAEHASCVWDVASGRYRGYEIAALCVCAIRFIPPVLCVYTVVITHAYRKYLQP